MDDAPQMWHPRLNNLHGRHLYAPMKMRIPVSTVVYVKLLITRIRAIVLKGPCESDNRITV